MSIHWRPDRVLVRFSGGEAEKLLNDVVTGVVRAGPGPARWWALLSPQGKIQAEGLLGWHADTFWLDVHRSVADAFIKRMKMYRLRAKVDIDDLRDTHRVGWSADWPQEAPAEAFAHTDARGIGHRVVTPAPEAAEAPADTVYTQARIAAGIAELGPDFLPDTTFPHDIGMDILEGLDFAKGCYIGQEVVSRMKHRGTARRRPVIVSGIPAGDGGALMAGSKEAGPIGTVVDGQAVGIIRLDRIADPAECSVAGTSVALTLPVWASYSFGEAAEPE